MLLEWQPGRGNLIVFELFLAAHSNRAYVLVKPWLLSRQLFDKTQGSHGASRKPFNAVGLITFYWIIGS